MRRTVVAIVLVAVGACGGDDTTDVTPRVTSGLGGTQATAPTTERTVPRELGTRSSPLPRGSEAKFENGWTVTVLDVVPDGTEAVLAENQFNDPPADGEQFYLVKISASYAGEGSSTPLGELSFSALDRGNLQIREGECGVVPDPFDSFLEVFDGGSSTGNLCFAVPSATADSLVMYVDAGLLDPQRAFLTLT